MLTKSSLVTMIETADQEKLARIVGRACVALFRRQTEDEKSMNAAVENNNRGFTQADARQGSITAKYFIIQITNPDPAKWTENKVSKVLDVKPPE